MDPLPAGTVTMLFTDIEGSTAVLSRLGSRYAEALSAQRRIIRGAIAAADGTEMGTEGDGFFVVFRTAHGAVSAALEAQRGLTSYEWPDGVSVRVRMGLHTGEPTRHEDGYVGIDVHLAARIAATAHGGQIVLSQASRDLVAGALPAGVSLIDLGWHRLKDIEQPARIFQVAAPDLRTDFPPLRSLGAPTNLPIPLTRIIGRDHELAELRDSFSAQTSA